MVTSRTSGAVYLAAAAVGIAVVCVLVFVSRGKDPSPAEPGTRVAPDDGAEEQEAASLTLRPPATERTEEQEPTQPKPAAVDIDPATVREPEDIELLESHWLALYGDLDKAAFIKAFGQKHLASDHSEVNALHSSKLENKDYEVVHSQERSKGGSYSFDVGEHFRSGDSAPLVKYHTCAEGLARTAITLEELGRTRDQIHELVWMELRLRSMRN